MGSAGVGRRQMTIPRTEGQPIGFANRRTPNDDGRQEERADHAAHECELLPVLLAEVRSFGLGDLEQLHDHCEDAVKVPGSVSAFQFQRAIRFGDAKSVAVGVEVLGSGQQQEVCVLGPEYSEVVLQGSRIAGQVSGVVELCGVDEDTDDRQVVLASTATYQRPMAVVQSAHGRHEAERESRARLRDARLAPRGDVLEHGRHE
jgi:hypothetical protein